MFWLLDAQRRWLTWFCAVVYRCRLCDRGDLTAESMYNHLRDFHDLEMTDQEYRPDYAYAPPDRHLAKNVKPGRP